MASDQKEAVGHSVAAELALLVAVVVLPLAGLGAYLLYDLSRGEFGPSRVLEATILLLAALAATAAAVVALVLIRRLLGPLKAISAAVRERGAGRAEVRLPETGPREVAELAGALNRMIDSGEQMQQAVRESEERYRKIAETSPDAIMVHSEFRIVLVNPAMVELMGARDATQLLGKPATFMLAPQTVSNAEQRMRRIYAGERLPSNTIGAVESSTSTRLPSMRRIYAGACAARRCSPSGAPA